MSRLAIGLLALAIVAADWPQWRGPNRDGTTHGEPWPDGLDRDRLKLLWSVELGPGYSGPVVRGGRVFVAESLGGKEESVRALDLATGELAWQARWPAEVSVVFIAKANGDWIKSTPACDGESLFVVGMRDVLVCLDAKTGRVNWRKDFVAEFGTPVPEFGSVSSPLVDGDHVYVQAAGSLVKLHKRTGEVVWRALETEGRMQDNPFASPVLATLAGERQLVAQSRKRLVGVAESGGRVLWSVEIPAAQDTNVLTPTVIGDRVFTSSYGGGSFLVEVSRDEDGFAARQLWRARPQGYMSSPVVIGGHVYLHLRTGRFCCLDLADGSEKWTSEPFGKYWSLAARGGSILALDQSGDLRLVRARTDEFDLLGEARVTEATSRAHLAVVGDVVLVRALDRLTAYRWE